MQGDVSYVRSVEWNDTPMHAQQHGPVVKMKEDGESKEICAKRSRVSARSCVALAFTDTHTHTHTHVRFQFQFRFRPLERLIHLCHCLLKAFLPLHPPSFYISLYCLTMSVKLDSVRGRKATHIGTCTPPSSSAMIVASCMVDRLINCSHVADNTILVGL